MRLRIALATAFLLASAASVPAGFGLHGSAGPAVVISAISSGTPGQTSANISYTTAPAAQGTVYYGLTTSYGVTVGPDITPVTNHNASLSGLVPGTTYHYKIGATASGYTQGFSSDQTFTTSTVSVATLAPLAGTWNGLAGSGWTGSALPAFGRQTITAIGSDSNATHCGSAITCVQLTVPTPAAQAGGGTGAFGTTGATPLVYVSGVNAHTEANVGAVGYVVDDHTIDLQGIVYTGGGTYFPTTPNWALVSVARGAQQITGVGGGAAALSKSGVTVRLTVTDATKLNDGELLTVSNSPVTEANGLWPITIVDGTHIDLGHADTNMTRYGPIWQSSTTGGGLLLSTMPAGAGLDEYSGFDMTTSPYYVTGGAISPNRHGIDHVTFYYEGNTSSAVTNQLQNGPLNSLSNKGTDGYVIGLQQPATGTSSGIADLYMDAVPVMGLDKRVSIHTFIDMDNGGTPHGKTAKVASPLPNGGSEPANCAALNAISNGSFATPWVSYLGLADSCVGIGTITSGSLLWIKYPPPDANNVVPPPVMTDVSSTTPSCGAVCLSNPVPIVTQGCDSSNGSSCQNVERAVTGAAWAVCTVATCPWVTDSAGHDALSNIAGLMTLTVDNSNAANAYPAGAETTATSTWLPVASGGTIPVTSCTGFKPGMNVIDPLRGNNDKQIGQVLTCTAGVLTTVCVGDNRATSGCIAHGSITASDPLIAGQMVLIEGMYPMEPVGIATIYKKTSSSITFLCCYFHGQVDMADPAVVHSGAPPIYGTVAIPYIVEVCPVPFKVTLCSNNGVWAAPARNSIYRDAIMDVGTIHDIYPYRDTNAPNVANSVYAPPLIGQVTFQNSHTGDLSGNEGPPYGYWSLVPASSFQLNPSGLRTASLAESSFTGGGGISAWATLRNVFSTTGWTVEVATQSWGASNLNVGAINETWFNLDSGMDAVPAQTGLYSEKGQVQPGLDRMTYEPQDDLTTTTCKYNYAAGADCMPAIAGNIVTANGAVSSGTAVTVNLNGVNPCNGVQGSMTIMDFSKSPKAVVGYVAPLGTGASSCSGNALTATLTASISNNDTLHIGEPLFLPDGSCGTGFSSAAHDCTQMLIYASQILPSGPGIVNFITGNCAIANPPLATNPNNVNGYMEGQNSHKYTFTGAGITLNSTIIDFAPATRPQGLPGGGSYPLTSPFFPIGTTVSVSGLTGTASKAALATATGSPSAGDGTLTDTHEIMMTQPVGVGLAPVALLIIDHNFTGGDSSKCGDGTNYDGSAAQIGDPTFIVNLSHTQFDKENISQNNSNGPYVLPELNLFQERISDYPETGFGPSFYANGSYAPNPVTTISSSGLTVTCSAYCGVVEQTTTSNSVSGKNITLAANCTVWLNDVQSNGGTYVFAYDIDQHTDYPVGHVDTCVSGQNQLVLDANPVFTINNGDHIVIIAPPTPGQYINITSGGAASTKYESRMVMGSAKEINKFTIDSLYSAPLSAASWLMAGSNPGMYIVDAEVGGNTGYTNNPAQFVTIAADGQPLGNEPTSGRHEESDRGKIWVQATIQAGGMYHQTTHTGSNGYYQNVILDSIWSADANHSAQALVGVTGPQTMSTDTTVKWNTVDNSTLLSMGGYYYDNNDFTVVLPGAAYPGSHTKTGDAIINDFNFRPCKSATWPNGNDIMGCIWPAISPNPAGHWISAYGVGLGPNGGGPLPTMLGHQNGPSGVADGTPLFPFDHDGIPISPGAYVGAAQP